MRDRVLANAYLRDVATGAGAPFADESTAAARLGVPMVVVELPAGLRALASEGGIYLADAAHAPLGVAQLLLLRAGVGHRDGDVEALALLVRLAQGKEQDSDAIPLDIDSQGN